MTETRRVAARTARLAVALLVVLVAVCASGGSALAASDIAVEAGYGGYAQPGRAYPITIEVTTDELFEGELRITSAGGSYGTTRQVEFAGGTTNEITTIVEQTPFDAGSLVVELVGDNGDVVAKTTVRLQNPSNVDLVGVFPGAAGSGLPEKVSTIADSGEARLFAIDPASLAAGLGVLGPIDVLVADAADLRALADSEMEMVLAWVSTGGRLLVDEPVQSEIPGIPAEWQPDGPMPERAGIGEVVLTDGAGRAGDWGSVLEPSSNRSRQEDGTFGDFAGFFGGEPLSWSLGRDTGFSLPGVGTMIALLAGYVLLVGPGVWFVLPSIHRPGLSWVIVPILAVGLTGVIWVAGSSYRDGVDVAHGSIIQVAPSGTVATTYELLNSRGGGTKSIELPDGWSSITSSQEGPPGFIDVESTTSGDRISTDVDAGGFVVLGGTGVLADFDDILEVEATSGASNDIQGTFTNRLDVDLHDVAVFADFAGVNIGDIGAGETVEFEITSAPVNPSNGQPVEFKVWKNAIPPEWSGDFGRQFAPGPVNLSLWGDVSAFSSVNARQVGQVVVAGWTEELASPIDPEVSIGRTLMITRGEIEASGDTLSDVAVQRSVVRASNELGSNFQMNDGWGAGAMVRYLVPESAVSTGELVLEVPTSQRRVELFVDGAWRQLDVAENSKGIFVLPDAAIDNGRVYVKALFNFERGFVWRDLSVRSATDGDDVVEMKLVPAAGT